MKKIFYLFLVLLIVSCSKDKNMANVLFQVSGGDGSLNCIYEDDVFTLNRNSLYEDGCTISSPTTGEVVSFGVISIVKPSDWTNTPNLKFTNFGILDFKTPSGRRIEILSEQDSINKSSSYNIPSTGFYSFKLSDVTDPFIVKVIYYVKN